MTIEQWRFFSVPHLLWHSASVYNGHLRGPLTLTPVAEHLVVELSLSVLRLRTVAAGIRTPKLPHARRTFYRTAPPSRSKASDTAWWETWEKTRSENLSVVFRFFNQWFEFEMYFEFKQLFFFFKSKWISFRNWIEKLYCNVCRILVIIQKGLIEPRILE